MRLRAITSLSVLCLRVVLQQFYGPGAPTGSQCHQSDQQHAHALTTLVALCFCTLSATAILITIVRGITLVPTRMVVKVIAGAGAVVVPAAAAAGVVVVVGVGVVVVVGGGGGVVVVVEIIVVLVTKYYLWLL